MSRQNVSLKDSLRFSSENKVFNPFLIEFIRADFKLKFK